MRQHATKFQVSFSIISSALIIWLLCFYARPARGQSPSCAPPPSGMVAWWPGDGNTIDIMSGNAGTPVRTVGFAPGEVGQAFNLNDTGYVAIPANLALDPPNALTVDAWVFPTTVPTGATIFAKDNSWFLGVSSTFGPGLITWDVDTTPVSAAVREITTVNPLTPGVWQHVAATFDLATQAMAIYVNGVQVPSTLYPGSVTVPFIYYGNEPVTIGSSSAGGYLWPGLVDELHIFNRALLPSEIAAIYATGNAGLFKGKVNPSFYCDQCAKFDIPNPQSYMQATVTLPLGAVTPPTPATIANYADACGFDSFNWQQQLTYYPPYPTVEFIREYPDDDPIIPKQPSLVPNSVYPASCSSVAAAEWPATECSLVAGSFGPSGPPPSPPFYDPPPGGYNYLSYNPYPFIFPVAPSPFFTPGDDMGCPFKPAGLYCPLIFPFVVSSDGTALSLVDAPSAPYLSGLSPSAKQPAGTNFWAFTTTLVGVSGQSSQGSVLCGVGFAYYCTPLYSWSWNSTFKGTAGGTAQTASIYPTDPGGTGGVTITSINGVPVPTVTVTPSSPTVTTTETLSVTVAVSGGVGNPTPTGFVVLTSGIYTSAVTTLNGGSATINIPPASLGTGTEY